MLRNTLSALWRTLLLVGMITMTSQVDGRFIQLENRENDIEDRNMLQPSIVDTGLEFLIDNSENYEGQTFDDEAVNEENGVDFDRRVPGRADGGRKLAPSRDSSFSGNQVARQRPPLTRQDAFDIPDEDEDELLRIRNSIDRIIEKRHRSSSSRTKQLSRPRRQAVPGSRKADLPGKLAKVPAARRVKRDLVPNSVSYNDFMDWIQPDQLEELDVPAEERVVVLRPKSLQDARNLVFEADSPVNPPTSGRPQFYIADDDEDTDNNEEEDDREEDAEISMNDEDLQKTLADLDQLAALQSALNRAKRQSEGFYEEPLPRQKIGFQRKSRARPYYPVEEDRNDLFDTEMDQAKSTKFAEEDPAIRGRFLVCQKVKDEFHQQLQFTGRTLELDECYVTCERQDGEKTFSHVFKLVDWPCGNRLEGKCLRDGSCTAFM